MKKAESRTLSARQHFGQCRAYWLFYLGRFFTAPASPVPSRSIVIGSGTALGTNVKCPEPLLESRSSQGVQSKKLVYAGVHFKSSARLLLKEMAAVVGTESIH